ncbi:MAG TPA: FAD-dependent oxidoreductase [Planctomycetota bacterium]|nr:FAD-dependent oxidoreductase [Planctomycetota bacterium]
MTQDLEATTEAMFPRLGAAAIERLLRFGRRRSARPGEILFEVGEPARSLFVLLEGRIEVVSPRPEGELIIRSLEPGEFTGEVATLLGRPALARARAASDCEVIELDHAQLRRILDTDAEVGEVFMRAFAQRRAALVARGLGDAVLIGSKHSADSLRLREFITRTGHPFTYLDVDRDRGVQELLDHFHVGTAEIPVLLQCRHPALRNPSNAEVADALGFNPVLAEKDVHDLVVVGAGPAGLAAAVYGASEGLDVLVVDSSAPGGQAGSSSRIENYLGFPDGISGQDLTQRALLQAQKFGAQVAVARQVRRLSCGRRPFAVELANGTRAYGRSFLIATGAAYRRPACGRLASFEGRGVYYGATHVEAQVCGGEEVAIVGAGNSAGQATVFLAAHARQIHVLVRGEGLTDNMSRYLIARIESAPNVTLRSRTEVIEVDGGDYLERVTWRDARTSRTETRDVRHLFLMTGAVPNTAWLERCVQLDEKGFVKTGRDLSAEELATGQWPLRRPPYPLETSIPGVFAVGDVRSGSVKRVASAVGEGSIAVQFVHAFLAE